MKTVYATPQDNLQQLFDSLQPHTTVVFADGVYHQKAVLRVPDVHLLGSGNTVLQFDDFAKKLDLNTQLLGGTFKSYTLAVCADDVTMENITVANCAGNAEKLGQEVAMSVYGTRFVAKNCKFQSTQDTLFCGPLPLDLVQRYKDFLPPHLNSGKPTLQRFENCTVCGTVDFVFGCADALFSHCTLVSLQDGRTGYVCAPAHDISQNVGFVFDCCNFVGENAPQVYLARPWRDFGKATFLHCTYQNHIAAEGFCGWQGTQREGTARFSEYCSESFRRVSWLQALSKQEAENLRNCFKTLFDF